MSHEPARNERDRFTDEHAERVGAVAVALHLFGDRLHGDLSVYDLIAVSDYLVTGSTAAGEGDK